MSKKILLLVISIIYLILIVFGLIAVYSAGAPEPAAKAPAAAAAVDGKIAIAHTEIFGELQRAQVIFDHKKHEEAMRQDGCAACHPVEDENKIVFTFPKKIDGKDWKAVMNAYHDECIGCHKLKKEGPVTCNDCHRKELAAVKTAYPAAAFDFADHYKHVRVMRDRFGKGDCGQCHHTYDSKEQKLVHKTGTEESCAYCHDLNKERGPELTAITRVTASKGLSTRRVSHQQCLGCHLEYRDAYQKMANKDTAHNIHKNKVQCAECHIPNSKAVVSCTICHIPTDCAKCHTGKYRTADDLRNTPRPDRGQPKRLLINIDNAKMKAVPFDHDRHQTASQTCRSCHHETLKACKECHTLAGKSEGNFINIARAYHDPFSTYSCQGCHNLMKTQKECYGCHHYIPIADIDSLGPRKELCAFCHSGDSRGAISRPPLSVAGLDSRGVPNKVKINVLSKEYEPSEFPHLDIVKKLVDISNRSKLANYFHRDMQTMCEGCHHRSPAEAEVKRDTPPNCGNCHAITSEHRNLDKVALLSAYHRQCIGCHDKMGIEKGNSISFKEGDRCAACHKKKVSGPTDIAVIKNDNVVKQNTKNILNVWRPK